MWFSVWSRRNDRYFNDNDLQRGRAEIVPKNSHGRLNPSNARKQNRGLAGVLRAPERLSQCAIATPEGRIKTR